MADSRRMFANGYIIFDVRIAFSPSFQSLPFIPAIVLRGIFLALDIRDD